MTTLTCNGCGRLYVALWGKGFWGVDTAVGSHIRPEDHGSGPYGIYTADHLTACHCDEGYTVTDERQGETDLTPQQAEMESDP